MIIHCYFYAKNKIKREIHSVTKNIIGEPTMIKGYKTMIYPTKEQANKIIKFCNQKIKCILQLIFKKSLRSRVV